MVAIVFWYWWALGAALLVCEMLLPGVMFLFLAIGAAAAGLVLLISGAGLEFQLLTFAVVAVASAFLLRPLLRGRQRRDAFRLNDRGRDLLGKVITLDAPILEGRGRVTLGDGSWTVVGPDMVRGARVRVTAVNGTELTVEPAR